jgi:hypothetical protein
LLSQRDRFQREFVSRHEKGAGVPEQLQPHKSANIRSATAEIRLIRDSFCPTERRPASSYLYGRRGLTRPGTA